MVVELIPAVLATTAAELKTRATIAQRLAPTVHLDLMDGVFVTTKSVNIKAIKEFTWRRSLELHAMVKHPAAWLPTLLSLQPRRVYLPCEVGAELRSVSKALQKHQIDVGLAINPATPVSRLNRYAGMISSILVMAVQPGRYHAPYWPGTVRRIQALHQRWPRMTIVCDGGMDTETIGPVIKAGAQRVVVGSAIILHRHPQQAWQNFLRLTR